MSLEHLINANIHRLKEGARVLEDIARFILKDDLLFKELRTLRHALLSSQPIKTPEMDLGGSSLKEKNARTDLLNVIQANALRMQEALRVLEESSPTTDQKQKIKSLRYDAYQLHQKIYQKMSYFLKKDKLKGLYLIIDPNIIGLPLKKIIDTINKTEINLVQLRNKKLNKKEFIEDALLFKKLLNPNTLFIINDHVDVALDIADGVHLGLEDYPVERVRAIAPTDFLIGATCHNVKEAKKAELQGASYLSIGCLFPTLSKKDTTPTSLSELKKIREQSSLPISCIGGIDLKNITKVLPCNTEMIALISSVWKTKNPEKTINKLQKIILKHT